MISLNSPAFLSLSKSCQSDTEIHHPTVDFSSYQQWNHQREWKNVLNNLRLIIQPIELDGLKKSEASELFNISRNTINLWFQRKAETGDVQALPNRPPGNNHKITDA